MKLKLSSFIKLNNGVKIPLLGLGTWQAKKNDCDKAVYSALKEGYRHIDTARFYGNEREVGNAIKRAMKDFNIKREELFVTTKVWNPFPSKTLSAFEDSLKKLDIDYIDLFLIHWPMPSRVKVWLKMQEILKSGKVKSIGVSNFSEKHIDELIQKKMIVPSVNQVEFSPFLYKKNLLKYCNRKGIALEAYSPLTRGKRLNDEKIFSIAKRYKKTSAQIMLRWVLEHNVIVIPKSVNLKRIKENCDLYDFRINKKDMKILDGMNEDYSSIW